MSKKYTTKKASSCSVDFDRYLMACEEGEYITKSLRSNEVRNVYIYSTLADVVVSSSRDEKITATLQGVFRDETQYFDMFRLSKENLYIFATCNVQSIAHTRLLVLLPGDAVYNVQIVTNCGEAEVDEQTLVNKLKLEVGNGIVPASRKN